MSTQVDERTALAQAPAELWIGGEWRGARSGATFAVEDPATGDTLAEVADATPEDGRAALDAAVAAAPAWAATAPRERSAILRRAYDLMTERAEDLAVLMTLEMGKPLPDSRGEVAYAADFLLWYSEEAVRGDGRIARSPNGAFDVLAIRQPVGPCVLITPWNFPAAMITRKLAPALAAGCTAVLKPAELTPLSALAIAGILEEAGLPSGVASILPTTEPGELIGPLLADPRTRKLSFTGSTAVGKALLRQAADNVLRTSMELGGNAPFIVFADADLDAAVDGAVFAKLRNVGEACTAANRFYAEAPIAEEFSERLAQRLGAMRIGRGLDEGVEVGPLIEDAAVAKAERIVADALDRGARALTGGERVEGPGHFYRPTVLSDVPPDAAPFREEIFAPVAPVASFRTEAEAIAAANATEYGLVAYLYTRDLDRAFAVGEALETGMIGLNQPLISNVGAPFGGWKQSGVGREGGPEGLEEYQEIKYIARKRPA
jgi:succinate-semialdehyde dehydrogenase / glutarate-semialdehyde dehydrogenase